MSKQVFLVTMIFCLGVPFFSGCVQTHAYLQDKERVDQDLPPGVTQPDRPKTRKIFIMEFNQKDKNLPETTETREVKKTETISGGSKVVTEQRDTTVVHESNFTFPRMTSERLTQDPGSGESPETPAKTTITVTEVPIRQELPPAQDLPTLPAEYKVLPDDTLQKISKKFYGSYAKWTKIYEANKEKIKDPNFLKSGTVLTIPVLD